ncbi:LPS-assembly lipoprotein LptE [Porticoccus sp.]
MKKLSCLVIAMFLATTAITGCGWHLRGTMQVNNISSVHISAEQRYNDFYNSLSRSLKANKIDVVQNATDAQYNIVILGQKSDRRTASVSVSARVSEYQLTEEVTIMILASDGKPLLSRTTFSSERVFDFDENDVQSKEDESNLLKREMRDDLIRQVVSRLNSVANRPTTAVAPAEHDAATN